MNTKILFTDLDDTLLNSQKQITQKNSLAIEAALARGHRIVINSGRPLMGITAQIEALGLNREGCYAVAYNGGLIYDCYQKKIVFQRTLSIPDVQYIFAQAERYGLYCQTYDSTQLLTPKAAPVMYDYVNRIKIPYKVDALCPSNLTEEPVKVLVIGDESRKQSDLYRASMENWAAGRISIFYSNQTYLEHVAEGVSKGDAMQQLCRLLSIPMENTIAAGDAENDLPMIRAAHTGVAVSNAAQQVKAAADYITEHDCNHDAIAEIIDKFMLSCI